MTNFERIVRPFRLPAYSPPAVTPQTVVPQSDTVVVQIGKSGEGYLFTGTESGSQTFYMDQRHTEKERIVNIKRVEQEDNPDNWVDVEAINRLKQLGPNGQKTYHIYHNNNETPDIQE